MALAAAPDRDLSALDVDDAGVRLDVALMHGLGLEVALDDDVGSGEAGIAVAELVLERAGDVGGGSRSRLGADVAHVLVQDGRTRLQGLVHVDDPGQHLVVDLDQLEGVGRDFVRYRRHRRDRVTHIERLLARHDVAAVEAQVLDAEGGRLVPWELDEVLADHDGLHAGQRQGLVEVDGPDAGMGVRAAQDLAPEHAGQGEVGSEGSTSRHLVDAVGPRRPLADPLVVRAVCAIAAVSTHPVALSCELPANRGPASIIALSASRIRRPRRHRIENLPWGTTLKPSLQRSAAYLQWASHACSRESWDAYLARFARGEPARRQWVGVRGGLGHRRWSVLPPLALARSASPRAVSGQGERVERPGRAGRGTQKWSQPGRARSSGRPSGPSIATPAPESASPIRVTVTPAARAAEANAAACADGTAASTS